MDKMLFYEYAELANHIYELVSNYQHNVIAVFSYDKIIELLKWFLSYDDIIIKNINIEEKYDEKYLIKINTNLEVELYPFENNTIFDNDFFYSIDSVIFLYEEDTDFEEICSEKDIDIYGIKIEEDNHCKDCCMDCSTCPNKNHFTEINNLLEKIDYFLNHIND